MEKYYKVRVSTPNLFINHKGRQIRTPVELKLHESELDLFKMKMRQVGTSEFSIDEYNTDHNIRTENVIINDEIIVEEDFNLDESSSILESLLKEK